MPFDQTLAENRNERVGIDNQYRSFRRSFVAAADGSITGSGDIESAGMATGIAFVPDETVAPSNTLTISLKDGDGLDMITPVVFASGKREPINPPVQFDSCSVSAANNTVNGAKGTIIVYSF